MTGKTMSETLRLWPLIEVIAEFHFDPERWKEELPDNLFWRLKADFPVRKKVQAWTHQFTVGLQQQQQTHQFFDRHQFFAEDETKLVQIDKNLLTVNHLQPYSDWEDFAPLVSETLAAYVDETQDKGLVTVALQYINRIQLPPGPVDIDKYFEFRPHMEGQFTQCGCMARQPWPEAESSIYRQMQTESTPQDALSVILVLNANSGKVGLPDAMIWLDKAHMKLNDEFRRSVTPELFAKFKPDTPR